MFLLVLAYSASTGPKAVKRLCVCVCTRMRMCACARACACVRVCVWNMEQLHGTKADCTVNCSNVAFCYLTLVLRNLL